MSIGIEKRKVHYKMACTHHFIIDAPNGKISIGTCKKCGKKQDHHNSIDFTHWSNSKYHGYTKRPKPRKKNSEKV